MAVQSDSKIIRKPAALSWEKIYHDLMEEVWRCGYENQVMYDMVPAYMDWCFGDRADVVHVVQQGETTVGFVGSSHRQVRIEGNARPLYLTHLFCIRKQDQNQRLGHRLLRTHLDHLFHQTPEALVAGYLDEGHGLHGLGRHFRGAGHFSAQHMLRLNFFTKILDMKAVHAAEPLTGLERLALWPPLQNWIECVPDFRLASGQVRLFEPADLPHCLKALNTYAALPKIRLARIWSENELSRQLHFPGLTRTWVWEDNQGLCGLLNFYLMHLRGRQTIRVGVMDEVWFGKRRASMRPAFLAHAIRDLKSHGVAAIVSQNTRYYPRSAFRALRFIPYPRFIHLLFVRPDCSVHDLKPLRPGEMYLEHR